MPLLVCVLSLRWIINLSWSDSAYHWMPNALSIGRCPYLSWNERKWRCCKWLTCVTCLLLLEVQPPLEEWKLSATLCGTKYQYPLGGEHCSQLKRFLFLVNAPLQVPQTGFLETADFQTIQNVVFMTNSVLVVHNEMLILHSFMFITDSVAKVAELHGSTNTYILTIVVPFCALNNWKNTIFGTIPCNIKGFNSL